MIPETTLQRSHVNQRLQSRGDPMSLIRDHDKTVDVDHCQAQRVGVHPLRQHRAKRLIRPQHRHPHPHPHANLHRHRLPPPSHPIPCLPTPPLSFSKRQNSAVRRRMPTWSMTPAQSNPTPTAPCASYLNSNNPVMETPTFQDRQR